MSNRAAVKRRFANDLMPAALADVDLGVTGRDHEEVPVAYGTPPDEATESCVYFAGLEPMTGRHDVTGMKRGGSRADDTFAINGTIDAFGFGSDQDSDEAVERILNRINATIRRCPHLIDPEDDAPSELPAYYVEWARLGEWSLANFAPIGDTHVSRISFSIECSTPTPKEGT